MQDTLGANVAPTYMYKFNHDLSFDCWGPDYAFCVGKVCHGSGKSKSESEFMGISLYIVGTLFNVECCIRQL